MNYSGDIVEAINRGMENMLISGMIQWPTFDGTKSVSRFIRRLDETKEIMRYSDDRMVRYVPLRLKGVALIKFRNYPDNVKAEYSLFKKALQEDFCSKERRELAKLKLNNICQKDREEIVVYAQRIRDLVDDAYYSNTSEVKESHETAVFMRGLQPRIRCLIREQGRKWATHSELIALSEEISINLEILEEENKRFGTREIEQTSKSFIVAAKATQKRSQQTDVRSQQLGNQKNRNHSRVSQRLRTRESDWKSDAIRRLLLSSVDRYEKRKRKSCVQLDRKEHYSTALPKATNRQQRQQAKGSDNDKPNNDISRSTP